MTPQQMLGFRADGREQAFAPACAVSSPGTESTSAMAMFRQPSSWISVLLPNAISDFLVHCLGHEHAYRIRSFCGHSNGCLLRIGTPSPFLHPPMPTPLSPRRRVLRLE